MLQVNGFCFGVKLRKIIMLCGVGYLVIIGLVLPLYYNTLRGRQLFEKNIGNRVKESESTLKLIDVFNSQGMVIVVSFKYSILLPTNTQRKMFKKIKRFYIGGEDINNIGYMIKRSDDIVYARGVKTVQMSEMVMFEIEGEKLYGIVKCLDSESVEGIAVGGDTIIVAKFSFDIINNATTEKIVAVSKDTKMEIEQQYQDLLKSLPKIEKD